MHIMNAAGGHATKTSFRTQIEVLQVGVVGKGVGGEASKGPSLKAKTLQQRHFPEIDRTQVPDLHGTVR